MANSCCGKWDPTVTDNELVWKAIEYAEVKKFYGTKVKFSKFFYEIF